MSAAPRSKRQRRRYRSCAQRPAPGAGRAVRRHEGTARRAALLELPSLDAALDWAARCPTAATGAVEVRAVSRGPDLVESEDGGRPARGCRARCPRILRAAVAFLSARTRDVAGAEDALSEAFMTALRTWPRDGVPVRPEAWLLTTARHKLIYRARHDACASMRRRRPATRREAEH